MIQKVKAKVSELIEEIELHAVDGVLAIDAEISSALGNLQAAAQHAHALIEAKLGDSEESEPQPVDAAGDVIPPPGEPAQEGKGDASEPAPEGV